MGVKPMNCPGHAHLYRLHAPLLPRPAACATPSPGCCTATRPRGVLHGLLRVRHFAQDDAHIFCTEEQIQDEVGGCLEFGFDTYRLFGFDVRLELSTRPEQRDRHRRDVGSSRGRRSRSALEQHGLAYELNPGDGAFYGPKIDMHMTDSLGRSWQLGTVQLDYSMPDRFELTLHGRRQRRAHAGDDPPRAVRLLRALHRHPARALRRRAARCGSRRCRRSCCPSPIASTTTARSVRDSLRGAGAARRARRPQRVDRAQDPRRGAAQDPVHARRRRARAGGGGCVRARAPRAGTSAPCRAAQFAQRLQASYNSRPVEASMTILRTPARSVRLTRAVITASAGSPQVRPAPARAGPRRGSTSASACPRCA